jgi:hypothetical protein
MVLLRLEISLRIFFSFDNSSCIFPQLFNEPIWIVFNNYELYRAKMVIYCNFHKPSEKSPKKLIISNNFQIIDD